MTAPQIWEQQEPGWHTHPTFGGICREDSGQWGCYPQSGGDENKPAHLAPTLGKAKHWLQTYPGARKTNREAVEAVLAGFEKVLAATQDADPEFFPFPFPRKFREITLSIADHVDENHQIGLTDIFDIGAQHEGTPEETLALMGNLHQVFEVILSHEGEELPKDAFADLIRGMKENIPASQKLAEETEVRWIPRP